MLSAPPSTIVAIMSEAHCAPRLHRAPRERLDRKRGGIGRKPAAISRAFVPLLVLMSHVATATPLVEPIMPVPQSLNQDTAKANIGRQLFLDVRLSANSSVSCASCHDPQKGGVDGRTRSIGFSGKATTVNTPSVLNAALNFRQFWDGRADSLEDQIDAVVQNPVEMGSSWVDVIAKLSRDPKYLRVFPGSYKDGITKANIQNALATYERTLITPNSRFDKYLRGDRDAITDAEKAGYLKFKQYGCIACHQGVNVGGNMFQKFGVMGDYFAARGSPTEADMGRYTVTHETDDQHVFKVPGLRNVALTAPYFHDGAAKTLDAAVEVMFRYQLGRVASRDDKQSIVKFLNTLTGELQAPPR
jgi:cytochrome c peroxidase